MQEEDDPHAQNQWNFQLSSFDLEPKLKDETGLHPKITLNNLFYKTSS